MLVKAAACLALAASTTSAQWEIFYDSRGFEHWDVGVVTDRWITIDDHFHWEKSEAGSSMLSVVSGATDPTLGDRSLRLDLGPVAARLELQLTTPPFSAMTPHGTRGIRIRFDVRRTPAEYMDAFTWRISTPGAWNEKGGHQLPRGVGLGSTTYLLSPTRYVGTRTDEWITVEHVFNFWDMHVTGSYGAFKTDMTIEDPNETGRLRSFTFRFASPLVPGWMDDETLWIDNLIVGYIGPCFADCDRSLALDLFDFLCFQNQFVAGDPEADCDQDGRLTFTDFLCFQDAFAADCEI